MATIGTVTGPIPAETLGVTLMHEHVTLYLLGYQHASDVELDRAAAFESAASALREFREAGGTTIVDAGGLVQGRDVVFLQDLSRVTGVNIVVTTGFPAQVHTPGHYYIYFPEIPGFYNRPLGAAPGPYPAWTREVPGNFYPSAGARPDYLGTLFYNELVVGLAAPGMIRMQKTAAAVIAGSSADSLTTMEGLSTRAAGQAARRTGAAVLLSSSLQAEAQLRLLEGEGLDAERVVVGHCDDRRTASLERDRALAERGTYVAYDHVGWEAAGPHAMADTQRAAQVDGMVEAGFADRVLLSCNATGYTVGWPRTSHRFGHLLKSFVPALRAAGVSDDIIHTILVENPARVLSRASEPSRAGGR